MYKKTITLCLGMLVLASCGQHADEVRETKLPADLTNGKVSVTALREDDRASIIYDEETKCQYIRMRLYDSGIALTPRLDENGFPLCGEPSSR